MQFDPDFTFKILCANVDESVKRPIFQIGVLLLLGHHGFQRVLAAADDGQSLFLRRGVGCRYTYLRPGIAPPAVQHIHDEIDQHNRLSHTGFVQNEKR